mmetsp:Transcript_24609/g.68551  ORF Transcript_24609/g.68551 Transcript_24609/m.68551 type:complete len:362 (+) Transcript_24609:152-1237(+)|eukprot:CAMPEP_0117523354 /NCGR_PEP_ID=MMETSP0784-20121206/34686_1 /TAXON_ID=39447 /ORGANISM="" /LENGTH=361 /DNA_ID=CAMNT_0005319467 /DNA_START=80 /DNA_END=1165 /DNA_ORIENTATION=+
MQQVQARLFFVIASLLAPGHTLVPIAPVQHGHVLEHSLLQTGSAEQVASSGTKATADPPRPVGHFLTNYELAPISSVACLEAKQRNPGMDCTQEAKDVGFVGELNAGNFPNYWDPICRSNVSGSGQGPAFLCDPHDVLTETERAILAEQLNRLRESAPVSCGRLLDNKVGSLHYSPFYLGVVVFKDWPLAQSGPDSLQMLGKIVASQWNMERLQVGKPQPYLRCPNTGILFILPSNSQVYLSTESCEFICQAKGGPEVQTAASVALRKKGAAAAAMSGAAKTYSFLGSLTGDITSLAHKPTNTGPSTSGVADPWVEPTGTISNNLQRILFVISIVVLVFSLGVGLLVMCLAPGLISKAQRK